MSDIRITIIDNENFYNGKLIVDNPCGKFIPKEDEEAEWADFNNFELNITDILIGRYFHSFEMGPSGTEMAVDGGDYFASSIIMMGDIGVYLCAEDAIFNGWMDFGIVHRNNIERLKPGMK